MRSLKSLNESGKIILAGFCFVGILCFIRVFVCESTLGWDEAEQVVIAQQLSAGYLAQPPLYYWLQYFFFQFFGSSLLSMALLKYSLIFLCFYFYHQICCLYCQDKLLAWAATFSWILIPNISIDLLPHRTHAISSLLAACLTWYWLIKPSPRETFLWYIVFGIIIGLGFLSKSNYFLFLLFLLLTTANVEEYRNKVFQKQILLSLFFAFLISSIYWFWLADNATKGIFSIYKLFLTNKNVTNGIFDLIKNFIVYGIPIFILSFYFPGWWHQAKTRNEEKLLWQYHFFAIPILLLIVIVAGFHDFKSHWALSLFFLTPLLVFSAVDKLKSYSPRRVKNFIFLCIIVQMIIFSAWISRTYRLSDFPLKELAEEIRKDNKDRFTFISPSQWLLGSLLLEFPEQKGFLLHRALLDAPFPQGKIILLWKGSRIPSWVHVLVPNCPERKAKKLIKNNFVRAGYLIIDLGKIKSKPA